MDSTEAALREALKKDPYDVAARLTLADYLEIELDRPEEAKIHRDWTAEKQKAAEKYFDELARLITVGDPPESEYHGWSDPLPEGEEMTRAMLIEAGRRWLDEEVPLELPMNNAGLEDRYWQREFWAHWGVLTDRKVPPTIMGIERTGETPWDDGHFVRCAC